MVPRPRRIDTYRTAREENRGVKVRLTFVPRGAGGRLPPAPRGTNWKNYLPSANMRIISQSLAASLKALMKAIANIMEVT